MEYTLDSVVHAMECLKEKLNIKKIEHQALLSSLEDLSERKQNVYYFGVLSFGNNIENIGVNLLGNRFIDCEVDTQIISLFENISFDKLSSQQIAKGQFRGFILFTEPSSYIYPNFPEIIVN